MTTRAPDPYGLSRVLDPAGVLPQRALRLDPSLPIGPDELLIDVESLNVDAASFRQLEKASHGNARRIGERIQEIVSQRGKMHNPVTGSGGMLVGKVREIGPDHPAAAVLKPGDSIATLVSLTLTPLHLDEIVAVHPKTDRVDVRGHAILFASGVYAKLPDDMTQNLSLAALDVCGAPAWAERLVAPGMKVLVLGAGKSGSLCLAVARRRMEGKGTIYLTDISEAAVGALHEAGLCDETLVLDATRPVDFYQAVKDATGGELCDLVINCASVPDTEMASILAVKEGGTVLFFSMATSFTAAALGAEGVGKDATLIMGNGFAQGHAELTLDLVREEPLRGLFEKRFGPA